MAAAVPNFTPAPDLDAILDRMTSRESGGNAKAVGKKGEVGLLQVMPDTARQYGVDPKLLTNPVVNRYVAKRYLTDLLGEFKGNLGLAIAGYNAGPGRVKSGTIPASTRSYVRDVLGGDSPALAVARPAATVPSARPSIVTQAQMGAPPVPTGSASKVLTIPSIVGKVLGTGPSPAGAETVPIPSGASIGAPKASKSVPIPHDATFDFPGPITMPAATPNKDPFAVRAAGYLPAIGQFAGETGGVAAGAAIPGLGETGVPEVAFATAGGAGGSALGAEGENAIRRQYGLPPVSVGGEAAIGGVGSLAGEAIPFAARFRKAAAVAKETGVSFRAALDKVMQQEAELEGKLGMGPRKAKMLENAPATSVKQGYSAGKQFGLRELGRDYDSLLSKFYHRMTPNSLKQLLDGTAGRMLEISGKPLRQALEDEIAKEPMTVRREQIIRSRIRQMRRALGPDTQAAAGVLGQLEKAATNDIKAVIGQAAGNQLDVIDTYFGEQMRRFPEPRALQKVYSEPAAAEVILKTAKGDEGRVVDMIREMRRAGQVETLRRGVAARIWQKAATGATSPDAQFNAIIKAVDSVNPAVFDELYGKGSQEQWVRTAQELRERTKELLKHPAEAMAIQAEVKRYLAEPGMARRMGEYLGHRAFFDMILIGSSFELGHLGIGIAGALGINLYEMVAHSPLAMRELERFATSQNPRAAARAFIAAINAAVHAGGQATLAPTTPDAPAGGPTP